MFKIATDVNKSILNLIGWRTPAKALCSMIVMSPRSIFNWTANNLSISIFYHILVVAYLTYLKWSFIVIFYSVWPKRDLGGHKLLKNTTWRWCEPTCHCLEYVLSYTISRHGYEAASASASASRSRRIWGQSFGFGFSFVLCISQRECFGFGFGLWGLELLLLRLRIVT